MTLLKVWGEVVAFVCRAWTRAGRVPLKEEAEAEEAEEAGTLLVPLLLLVLLVVAAVLPASFFFFAMVLCCYGGGNGLGMRVVIVTQKRSGRDTIRQSEVKMTSDRRDITLENGLRSKKVIINQRKMKDSMDTKRVCIACSMSFCAHHCAWSKG